MSLNLKLVKGLEIRKAHLLPQNMPELYACIDSIFGSTDFNITYLDSEGDNVTVLSQKDLEDAYSSAVSENKPFIKFYLEIADRPQSDYIKESARQVESEDEEVEEEFVVLEAAPVETLSVMLEVEPKVQVDVEVKETSPEEVICPSPLVEVLETVPINEVEMPQPVEEQKINQRRCNLKKAMKAAAKNMKHTLKRQCKAGRQACIKPKEGPLFTSEQIDFIRGVIREELGQTKPVHSRFTCDGCGVHPIVGVRYNCTVCRNFDFCEVCEAKTEHNHPFIKHKTPVVPQPAPRSNEVVIDLDLGNVLPFVPEQMNEIVSNIQRQIQDKFAPKIKGLQGKSVEHLTLAKLAECLPETEYVKAWVVCNVGKVAWPQGTKLIKVNGQIQALGDIEVPALAPGETAEVSVGIKTPARLGKARGIWRFQTPEGQIFGRVKCVVKLVKANVMPELVIAEASSPQAEMTVETEASEAFTFVAEPVEIPISSPVEISLSTPVLSPCIAPVEIEAPVYLPLEVVQLMGMGFSEEAARIALQENKNDINLAVSFLFRQ